MDSKQVAELTSRVVAGERLTPDEERWLMKWMEERPEARSELLVNEELDSALRCLDHLTETEDEFVEATLRHVSRTDSRPGVSTLRSQPGSNPAGGYSRESAIQRVRANRLEKVFALCATVLLMGSLAWLVWIGLRSVIDSNRPPESAEESVDDSRDDSRDESLEDDRLPPGQGFAYIASADGVVWDTPHAKGDRLSAGVLKLVQGESVIRFDKGTEARLMGPAVLDLRSPDEVLLTRGNLTVSVPRRAVGFTVETPVGRVVDLGTVFDVSVESSGKTETLVRRGKVLFSPQSKGGIPGKPIELTPSGLDRAISSVPAISGPTLPVSTIVSGSQGRFMGVISAGGQTLEFGSIEAFKDYQAFMLKQLRESPSDFDNHWSTMVKSRATSQAGSSAAAGSFDFGSSSGAQSRSISITENGKTVSITESTGTGITVTVKETVDGKQRQTVVKAKNEAELKEKNAEAFRLYDRHFGAAK